MTWKIGKGFLRKRAALYMRYCDGSVRAVEVDRAARWLRDVRSRNAPRMVT